ncbi:uncharacterized protein C8R40DRAFT_7131 [Lentinula edodes]|uniref:uncharacterized protein n=1 Tax=Lentinula edodes TaxID=5353 RepID=UPI001E8D9EFA|nr:uncharacterized protein C8R40DRAFT_7131 [Lentinula edodes]KAH7880964.1 hypothetical protein C8R40DRAFT_7131 [Lentinula edodes]
MNCYQPTVASNIRSLGFNSNYSCATIDSKIFFVLSLLRVFVDFCFMFRPSSPLIYSYSSSPAFPTYIPFSSHTIPCLVVVFVIYLYPYIPLIRTVHTLLFAIYLRTLVPLLYVYKIAPFM